MPPRAKRPAEHSEEQICEVVAEEDDITPQDEEEFFFYDVEDGDVDDRDDIFVKIKRPVVVQQALTLEEISKRQGKDIADVAEKLNVSRTIAAMVLQALDWQFTFDRWLTLLSEEQRGILLQEAHLERASSSSLTPPTTGGGGYCPICWDTSDSDDPPDYVTLRPCAHTFHAGCLKGYLQHCLDTLGPRALLVSCPTQGCPVHCHAAVFESLLSASKMGQYYEFRRCSYVAAHPLYRWCPTCSLAIYKSDFVPGKPVVVQCPSCHDECCFQCGKEAHAPCDCTQVLHWLQKEQDESETCVYLATFTKPCPGCGASISKTEGCNKMVCRCGRVFCWLCLGAWDIPQYRCKDKMCQLWDGSAAVDSSKLDKYFFYYTRYNNHDKSKKIESKLMDTIRAESSIMEDRMPAAKQLIQCRRMLKYTYVYAFYLDPTDPKEMTRKELFEFNQAELERYTGRLSEMLEGSKEKFEYRDIVQIQSIAHHMLTQLRLGLETKQA